MVMVRPLSPELCYHKLTSYHDNSIVISCFAIVILSVIGALFKANHHSMVGTINDPKDGAAVAGTVFSAVIVYAVRPTTPSIYTFRGLKEYEKKNRRNHGRNLADFSGTGFPFWMQLPGLASLARESKRCYYAFVTGTRILRWEGV